MSSGLYNGASGLALGTGLYRTVSGLWSGASGLDAGFSGASLDLNFLTGTLDPRITFTRASTATFVESNGLIQSAAANVPRFDFDPVTLQPRGLLIEESRTNLLLRSADLENASWTKVNSSITSTTVTAPDGTQVKKFVESGATGQHNTLQSATVAANTSHTLSTFVRAGERDKIWLQAANPGFSSGFRALVDLAAQTVSTATFGTGTVAGARLVPWGNGWFRATVTGIIDAASTSLVYGVFMRNAAGADNYAGDGTSGLFPWGAQLEAGAFATSYIPTAVSQVTRSADVPDMIGTNFSDWFEAAQGTFVAEFDKPNTPATGRVFTVSDGTANNQIRLNGSVGAQVRPDWQIVTGGVVQANITDGPTGPAGTVIKSAGSYSANDFALATNGTLGTPDNSGTLPTVNRMRLGANEAGAGYLNGRIRRLIYYPRRLPNSMLQALTVGV